MSAVDNSPAHRLRRRLLPGSVIRVTGLNRKRILLATAALVAPAFVPGIIDRLRQPLYEGKRVGEWFDLLFVSRNSSDPESASRNQAASEAFSRMDSNAVPFLVGKLMRRAPFQQTILNLVRHKPIEFANSFVGKLLYRSALPTQERHMAAVALRQMGTNAEASAPVLLAEYQAGKDLMNLMALSFVLGKPYRPTNGQVAVNELEEEVMKVASERLPHLFPPQPVPLTSGSADIPQGGSGTYF